MEQFKMKLTKVATAFAALAIAGVGTAHADSFASASFTQTNFQWLDNATGKQLTAAFAGTAGTFDALLNINGQNSANANATIDGAGPATITATPSIASGGQIAFSSTSTGPNGVAPGAASPNPYPTNTTPNGLSYAYGSYSLNGAVIDITLPGGGGRILGGANTTSDSQVALANNIASPSTGTSQSSVGANVAFLATITSTITTHFVTDYAIHLLANVSPQFGDSDNARAGSSFTLTVTDITHNIAARNFKWSPDDLNTVVATGAGDGLQIFDSVVNGTLGDTAGISNNFTLYAGDTYRFSINAQRFTDAGRNVVPEPGSLALLGIGLVGVAASTLRKKKA
jgi:hypothetical protein